MKSKFRMLPMRVELDREDDDSGDTARGRALHICGGVAQPWWWNELGNGNCGSCRCENQKRESRNWTNIVEERNEEGTCF